MRSLMEHRASIEALTTEDPEIYVRNLIEGFAHEEARRFGGRPAVIFRLFTR